MRTILLVDNYDSFTWNLRQLLAAVAPPDARVVVVANDARSADELLAASPWRVVISPGPGDPTRAGVSNELLLRADVPTLGVCLGHQCLAHAYGGRVVRGAAPVHGKAAPVIHDGRGVFAGLPSPLRAARYHSLVVDEPSLPPCLEVTARSDDGAVMGLRHRERPVAGVQFHPESVLSEHGAALARNFLAGRV
ncbi:MAG: aminodeoxychorismate/anthranilate synthase component II [Polyangiales bacterium]